MQGVKAAEAEIGQRVRAARLVRGLSQTALAEKLGVTFQQVQKYEKGVNRIAVSRMRVIAAFLDVSFEELACGGEAIDGSAGLGKLDLAIAREAAELDDAGKRSILAIVRQVRAATGRQAERSGTSRERGDAVEVEIAATPAAH